MFCIECEYEFVENDEYYKFENEILCEECIDDYIENYIDEHSFIYNPRAELDDLALDIQRGK